MARRLAISPFIIVTVIGTIAARPTAAAVPAPQAASAPQAQDTLAFRNADLPLDARVADLVGRLTLEEKAGQLGTSAPAIPRLGIPAYDYWSEALHGVARAGVATVFPQAIGLAATWDTDLMQRVATAISLEARAKFNETGRRGEPWHLRGTHVLLAEHQHLP